MTETPTTLDALANAAPVERPSVYFGLGRRKSAVARIRMKPNGSGNITIKKRSIEDYFQREQDRIYMLQPLRLTGARPRYDFVINVKGGGMTGQAGAIRLGLARVIAKAEPELYHQLKEAGYLTRDARKVERKKPGKAGARASFQFSKR